MYRFNITLTISFFIIFNYFLFLLEECFPVIHTVTVPFELDHFATIQKSIQDSSCQYFIIQCLSPLAGRFVGGDDDRALFMQVIDQVEQGDRLTLFYREHHDVINGNQMCLGVPLVGAHCRGDDLFSVQHADHVCHGGKIGPVTFPDGIIDQPAGQ